MNTDAQRDLIIYKDEDNGYIERENAIHEFLMGDVPQEHGEKYVLALEYVLERMSTPIEDWDVLLGRAVEGPIPYKMEIVHGGGWSHAGNPFQVRYRQAGHLSLDYGSLMRNGLGGISARVAAAAKTPAQQCYAALTERAVAAIGKFAARYAAAARRKGMLRAADALERVPLGPAYDFFSAMQSVWFVEFVLSCAIGGRDFAYSRLDLDLLPYYDIDNAEDVHNILTAFMIKNNEIGGLRSELGKTMPVPCAATNIYVMLGGRGANEALPLSMQFLRAAKEARLPQPVLALRYDIAGSPSEWKLACMDAAQALGGQVSIYNDEKIIKNYIDLGFTEEQAADYTMSGCNRAEFSGHQSSDIFHNLPPWLLEAFYDESVTDMDGLVAAFKGICKRGIQSFPGCYRAPQEDELHFNLESLLFKGCVENACDIENGGLSMESVVHNLCSIATVADSLAAIEKLVFEDRELTLDEFRTIVRDNYTNAPQLAARLKNNFPKYGNDNPAADFWAREIGVFLAETVREMRKVNGRVHVPSFYTLFNHQRFGRMTGATPDGRLAGEPLSENQSAVYGCDTQGVTALLHSVLALPHELCGAGGFNLRLAKICDNKLLAGLTDTFFNMGALNITPYVVSRETLLAARESPEQYRSLTVRIAGFAELYLNLPEFMQLEILQRTEAAL